MRGRNTVGLSIGTSSKRVMVPEEHQHRVKVFLRWKSPPNLRSISVDSTRISFLRQDPPQTLTFDGNLIEASQQEVYEVLCAPLLNRVFNGANVCVLAYGQSGSGKTYSVSGDQTKEGEGFFPRFVQAIFENARNYQSVLVSYGMLEIYRETLIDLLNDQGQHVDLRIREGKGPNDTFVEGMIFKKATSAEELLGVFAEGNRNRAINDTGLNSRSSRGHLINYVKLSFSNGQTIYSSKILVLDLAGSERVRKSNAEGEILEEGKKINLSLSALGNVIAALAARSEFIPYRDSKITRILQPAFGGDSMTHLLCTVSGDRAHESETISTIQFGARSLSVMNKVNCHQQSISSTSGDESILKLVQGLRSEISDLKARVARYETLQRTYDWSSSSSVDAPSRASSSSSISSSLISKDDRDEDLLTVLDEGSDIDFLLADLEKLGVDSLNSYSQESEEKMSANTDDMINKEARGCTPSTCYGGAPPSFIECATQLWLHENADTQQQALESLYSQYKILADKYAESRIKQFHLHNQLQEAHDKIRILSRSVEELRYYHSTAEFMDFETNYCQPERAGTDGLY